MRTKRCSLAPVCAAVTISHAQTLVPEVDHEMQRMGFDAATSAREADSKSLELGQVRTEDTRVQESLLSMSLRGILC